MDSAGHGLKNRYRFSDFIFYTVLLAVPMITAVIGILDHSVWWTAVFAVLAVGMTTLIIKFFCTRCPHYTREGKTLKCIFFWGLPKFFNINQVEATQYYKLMNKEILNITAKEDGSLVAFMQLPNKKLFSKTIGSFVSDQAQLAYSFLYEWEEKAEWVKMAIGAGFTPLFEYVSGPNRIVLKYSKKDLRFLGLRDNFTGEWIPSTELSGQDEIPFTLPKSEEIVPLKHLMERAKTEEDAEGWVVRFKDIMVKIKTAWHFKL